MALGAILLLPDCAGVQSVLDPAGPEARSVAVLFWGMAQFGAAIWLGLVLAYLHARRSERRVWTTRAAGRLIVLGGAVFPATVLLALLCYALWLMPALKP